MTNEKKLELTLCGMLPYNLMGKVKGKESIDKLLGIYGTGSHSLTICFRVNNHNTVDYDCNLQEFKPLLHSLDKLINDILEDENDYFYKLSLELCDILESNSCEYFIKSLIYNTKYVVDVNKTVDALEFLKYKHFNIYDLPKEMYIEKLLV